MRVAILSAILFLSGIGSLIFETLWLRLSGLAFGNSVWSAALILSSFMAGLALGNALAASSRPRSWRPLHLYAFLELIVALLGCTIVFGLPLLGSWFRPVFQAVWNYQPLLIGLRFVLSFFVLTLPATVMGLTLPVLIEDPILRRTDFGRAIGFLYGCNTLGAVAGALLGEACLIRVFGLVGTGVIAALANSLAGLVAMAVAQRRGSIDLIPHRAKSLRLRVFYRPPWRLLLISFGTGSILLCLEVVWFRFLRLYVVSSPTAFSVMLAVVLLGIGLGGLVSGMIHRRLAQSTHSLAILLLVAANAALLSYQFFPGEAVRTRAGAFDLASWWQIGLLGLALMFPVAFISGILFPFVAARIQTLVQDRMNSTGVTTLFNTLGATFGPLLASFVLLPTVGFQSSLLLCAISYAVLALLVSEWRGWTPRRAAGITLWTLFASVILLICIFPYGRVDRHFAHASLPYQVDDHGQLVAKVVKKVEGRADTFQLLRRELFDQPYYYRLLTNAFSMSATNPHSQRYMRLFAYLPLALRPEAKDALLICYGCGVTADAFLHDARLSRLDIVDISKEVFELADFYSGINYSNPLRDPRVTPFVQDGRFFLQASPRQYDVISGEPPPPKIAGSVNLYTQEFFSLMKSRLRENGIATFWLPINQLKIEEAKAILRAFHNAFANASVWASADEEWIMLGINGRGRAIKEDEIRRLWNDSDTGADLRRIGLEVPQQLGALFLMDADEIDRTTRGVAPLTDFYPKRLSDELWDAQASYRFAIEYMTAPSALQHFHHSPLINSIFPEALIASAEPYFVVRETRYLSDTIGSNRLAELDLYLRHSRLRTPVLEVLHSDQFRLGIAEAVARASQTPPPETLPDLLAGALARRDFDGAIRLLERERGLGRFEADDLFLLTYLYCLSGEVDKAEALAASNPELINNQDWFVAWLWRKLQADFGFRPPA